MLHTKLSRHVNEVSIVSPKPQTTRQRILGTGPSERARLLRRPGLIGAKTRASPNHSSRVLRASRASCGEAEAVFADTAGIMDIGQNTSEFGFRR